MVITGKRISSPEFGLNDEKRWLAGSETIVVNTVQINS